MYKEKPAEKRINTELVRYVVSTAAVSLGMSFGAYSPAALMNMHSSRLFMTAQETFEKWKYSGLDAVQTAASASSMLASCSVLLAGKTRVSNFLECTHLAVEAANRIEQCVRVWRIFRRTPSERKKTILSMHRKAVACMAISLVELISFSLGVWPIYLAVNILKAAHFLLDAYDGSECFQARKVYDAIKSCVA
ncbi:uncharacterized protein NEMAJ01_1090 [Nematocida major]|uniref:uncharacterized protein n=1 Tax=Nematocida major TaxID=1912982 RepID=UPI0020087F5A|nr:uncharacterized protein NEMAJ01_1090 [Nematocida major]KAH9386194.1 hypothetical protein NEMAJ01_1090 [Nematocida major]